ncbi:hypothetical protein IVB34_01585 [Bradyrhizobium sp. 2]|uniref:hypothetical protein n=1 Tax=Bradyrhizobium sp. 2 TaxID=190045 RepID=UPI001FFB813D|nr:hypothetical protein [Bradyrhizobium sp. 2]MCK1457085.1 hypothetical protein [Bradyrhizobium sp. 2]
MAEGDDKSGGLVDTLIGAAAGLPIPLKKTGAAIDRLLSVPFNVWADQLDAKMRGNTNKHVEAVETKRKKKGKKTTADDASVKTAKTLADWTVSASEVNEDDPQLSAVWRGLLDAILDDRDDPDELLRIVQATSPSDLRLFLTRGRTPTGLLLMNNAVADRLKTNGLVEPFMPRTMFFLMMVFTGTVVLLWTQMQTRSLDRLDQFPFQTVAYGVSALIPIVFFWVSLRPSRQGRKLIDLYKEYCLNKD